MFFNDLSDYSYYLKKPVSNVKNVGWLDTNHVFPVGKSSKRFLLKLERIISSQGVTNVHVNQIRGVHVCALSKSCQHVVVGNGKVGLGSSEVWIPSDDGQYFFSAPSLIFHYIRDHDYLPPQEFIDAVEKMSLEIPFNAQEKYIDLVAGHF